MHLTKMRSLTFDFINQMPFLKSLQSIARYLTFPKTCNTIKTSAKLTETILKLSRVALVPVGINWFESQYEGHIRICYSASEEILNNAFERIWEQKNNLWKLFFRINSKIRNFKNDT
jgi:aspartate/methionine/tyrosine aminotransferase